MRRAWPLARAALALSLFVLLAGCAAANDGGRQRHKGFYGGVEGGLTR